MEKIDWIRTWLVPVVSIIISIGAAITSYYRTLHSLELKFRDKMEEQLKQMADLKVEIEKLKSKDELQQQIIDQLKKHVLDNLPALYKALEDKKND